MFHGEVDANGQVATSRAPVAGCEAAAFATGAEALGVGGGAHPATTMIPTAAAVAANQADLVRKKLIRAPRVAGRDMGCFDRDLRHLEWSEGHVTWN